MRHKYQVKDELKHVYSQLKGCDATVYEGLRALGFEPVLYLNYRCNYPDSEDEDEDPDTFLLDEVFHIMGYTAIWDNVRYSMQQLHAIMVPSEEQVTWVTPETTFSTLKTPYVFVCDDPYLEFANGNLCLIVRIGSVADRLAHHRSHTRKKQRVE
ncbi:hypothetical protein BGW80DRAFT_1339271 [Lactifluus volemus]|nr:hypothetical protein BGW80DRAFT_1339271 [Lactifluus volemus]